MDLHCAPIAFQKNGDINTCFNHSELKLLANEFNKHSKKSSNNNKKIKVSQTKDGLVENLKTAYREICNENQFCWIEQHLSNSSKKEQLLQKFRPIKPLSWYKNKNTWLNTYDIQYVLEQYQVLHKNFKFLGVQPIDFESKNSSNNCIGDDFCDFTVAKLKSLKKTQFAAVFNTDPSYKSGQHWISMYCNVNPKKPNYGIYFYDSVANDAPKEIRKFAQRIVKEMNDPKFKYHENRIQRQRSSYDCGVFSIVFITQCLKYIEFNEICERMHYDNYINSLRDVLYRPNLEVL